MDMIKYNTPQELFTAICDKIRDKTNSNELINHQDIPDKIDNLVDINNIFVLKYNQTLSTMMDQSIITEISDNEIKSINISFSDNQDLVTINLPKCTYVCNFTDCFNLTTIDLPECTSIGSSAFYNCTSLTTVNLPKCTSIGDSAFNSCTTLATIDLPECTSIEYYAFNRCTNLTTINLPECTDIRTCAFESCTSLTTIDLPKCTSINGGAFSRCTSLATIILNNNQIVSLENTNAFSSSGISRRTGRIYVPDNLVDSYKTATNWSTYANQIKPISELPSNLKEEYGYE